MPTKKPHSTNEAVETGPMGGRWKAFRTAVHWSPNRRPSTRNSQILITSPASRPPRITRFQFIFCIVHSLVGCQPAAADSEYIHLFAPRFKRIRPNWAELLLLAHGLAVEAVQAGRQQRDIDNQQRAQNH